MEILLADDEKSIVVTLRDALEAAGHRVTAVFEGRAALEAIARKTFDLVISDIRMPGADGVEVLRRARGSFPPTDVILITGFGTIDQAVEAMREGAYTYLTKPFLNEAVVETAGKIAHLRKLEEENTRLRAALHEENFGEIVGRSRRMLEVFRLIETVAPTDATVLIEGESGTGKEKVAKAIHRRSSRASGPFLPLSCASLPEGLLESELFGHEKGAFTDARQMKRGRFELANGGTLFLDDIDDLSLGTQVKLLRVLQERSFERLGAEKPIQVDIRIVAATKVSLEARVKEGRFRDDLFWRLHVVPIRIPSLRDREGDVPLLARHFIRLHGKGKDYRIRPEVLAAMERYPWPGNVRELENAIERAIALAGNSLLLEKANLLPPSREFKTAHEVKGELPTLRQVLEVAERTHLVRILGQTGWHRTQAAKLLGISRKVLWEKMRAYLIEEPKP